MPLQSSRLLSRIVSQGVTVWGEGVGRGGKEGKGFDPFPDNFCTIKRRLPRSIRIFMGLYYCKGKGCVCCCGGGGWKSNEDTHVPRIPVHLEGSIRFTTTSIFLSFTPLLRIVFFFSKFPSSLSPPP